jgi:hypothetical protein
MFLVSDGNEYKALHLLKGWPYYFCVSVNCGVKMGEGEEQLQELGETNSHVLTAAENSGLAY